LTTLCQSFLCRQSQQEQDLAGRGACCGPYSNSECWCDQVEADEQLQPTRAQEGNTKLTNEDRRSTDLKVTMYTKTDAGAKVTANRQAPPPQQNSQSRKGVSAPGNTCRHTASVSNSAHERYTGMSTTYEKTHAISSACVLGVNDDSQPMVVSNA
jgi:hypothetical protein